MYDFAIQINPNNSILRFNRALHINPNIFQAYYNKGVTIQFII